MSKEFRNPVPGSQLPSAGAKGYFLFKRRDDHFHQGLDIGALYDRKLNSHGSEADYQRARHARELEILAIASGRVKKVKRTHEAGKSHGRFVVIEADPLPEFPKTRLWFLYAHCEKVLVNESDVVHAGQPIAILGGTGNPEFVREDGTVVVKNPHLHLEVSTERLPAGLGPAFETTPEIQRARINPHEVLVKLGPFPTRELHFIHDHLVGEKAARALHEFVESSSTGGFFPLGANNTWHGGVHVPMTTGSPVFAPFDATIVAARLEADAARARGAFGSTNFILLRHELMQPADAVMVAGGGGSNLPPRKVVIGRGGTNEPPLVVKVKHRLRALAHYPEPEPPAPDLVDVGDVTDEEPFFAAIEEFQKTLPPVKKVPWPDGEINVPGKTWKALFPDEPFGPLDPELPGSPLSKTPTDPRRTIYCLLMHLDAREIASVSAESAPWLYRATHPPDDEDPALAEKRERERREDADEAKRPLVLNQAVTRKRRLAHGHATRDGARPHSSLGLVAVSQVFGAYSLSILRWRLTEA